MPRVVIRASLAFLVVLLAIQLKQPDRTNPPVDPSQSLDRHLPVPAAVRDVLDRACRDCHSSETRWPAYAYSRRSPGTSPGTSARAARR